MGSFVDLRRLAFRLRDLISGSHHLFGRLTGQAGGFAFAIEQIEVVTLIEHQLDYATRMYSLAGPRRVRIDA